MFSRLGELLICERYGVAHADSESLGLEGGHLPYRFWPLLLFFY